MDVMCVSAKWWNFISWGFDISAVIMWLLAGMAWISLTKTRREARFGFHRHLSVYITQLKHLISEPANPDVPKFSVWYNLSESLRKNVIYKEQGEAVQKLAVEFIKYLCSAPNQVMPTKCGKKEWGQKMKQLQDYLNDFASIGSSVYLSKYETEEKINDEYEKLKKVLDWVDDKLNGRQNSWT